MQPFATIDDIDARYPAELIVLAADEVTGETDTVRVTAACEDASSEARAILKARYTTAELGNLDLDSLETLRLYTIDIALYRIALSFSRSNERIKERYEAAIKRLEAIASGRGGLSFASSDGGDDGSIETTGSPNEVLIEVPERVFSRDRLSGW
ncbi:phage protein Gp36 family protein [Breoghania sp.]|uniref:gp436 family protein n=1 Tax=Breoghania sp. TaxID=2065378 RepID=UPI0029C9EB6B|nr:phage protein Gp36 family protein [Breoghania sp.]